jgi:predicted esterase
VTAAGPHAGQPPLTAGPPAAEASAALVLVHGRGGSPEDILGLADVLERPGLAVIAPRAAGRTWYPQSFMAPVAANEPGRSSGLSVLDATLEDLAAAGIPPERVLLAGFSQGACLTLELVARHPRRYAAVAARTGGLIGAPGELVGYRGSLAGTPVLLTSGDPDPHVPWSRVEETAAILTDLGAEIDLHRYPGRPHTVSPDELRRFVALVNAALDGEGGG